MQRLRRASVGSGLPWRMCETNSFFGGGRPGVSDTFTGALWTLDYMLLLAGAGCAGVNMETGVNQLGFISSYSPIQDDGAGRNSAGVPYYGMLAFALATRDAPDVYATALPLAGGDIRAYALGKAGRLRSVVLINRSVERSVRISLPMAPWDNFTAVRLSAPSLDSRTDITLGGASMDASGAWSPASEPSLHGKVDLPAGSAVILRAS